MYETKKNVLFLMIGPPTTPPHCRSRSIGRDWPELLRAHGLAFSTSLWRYPNAVPCSSLVPDLVMILKTPPGCLPNSAEVLEVEMFTSATASGFGNCSAVFRNGPVLSLPAR